VSAKVTEMNFAKGFAGRIALAIEGRRQKAKPL
jgi:hypothetical protein